MPTLEKERTTSAEDLAVPAKDGRRPRTVIQAGGSRLSSSLGRLWDYRDLLLLLTRRDVTVRYKQTALGTAWIFLSPLLAMGVYTLIFGIFARMPTEGLPYALYFFCGYLAWQLFALTVSGTASCLNANKNLISKVYFPRLIIPLSTVLARCVDFPAFLVLLLAVTVLFGYVPTAMILILPLLLVFSMLAALAVGLWLAALTARYRDVSLLLPSLLQFWMFSTPIIYPVNIIPTSLRPFYDLNPMTQAVLGYRWALLGVGDAPGPSLFLSLGIVLVLLAAGVVFFQRTERMLADLL
jgi:lipopolysaccharide transport system permease protein